MSKDKGSKDKKKSPASKTGGKDKAVSAYKSEGKSGAEKPGLDVFSPKSDSKPAPNPKNKA
ncbi:MAG: hypothetical protein KBG02_04955 [Haliscomenobacter sp.]|nr:hypothetical protein [Haliscomenobacter sp.]MBP9076187.1 hypothetical protein [Haliscomenobacter sp.]